jgi:hypothetical protein
MGAARPSTDWVTCQGEGVTPTSLDAVQMGHLITQDLEEYISADGRSLHPLIIWSAATYRSTWTTYPIPEWHFAYSKTRYTDIAISLY